MSERGPAQLLRLQKNNRMKTLVTIAACIVLFIAMTAALAYGMQKSERVSCLKWQEQADQYPGYYLLKWQKVQCDAHGIVINSEVR